MTSRRAKPSDHFTRFTSATPHASTFQASQSAPPAGPGSPPGRSNGPPGETPAQKVARLRAAHRAAQEAANYSLMDRVITNGRVVADKLHRGVAYSLVGVTIIFSAASIYSFFSLASHHRRQKRAWIESELQRLSDAQVAFLRGDATAEQLHLLEQERAGEEIQIQREQEKRIQKANSLWGRTKRAFYGLGGVKEEEGMGDLARKGEFSGIMDMVRQKRLEEAERGDHRLLSEDLSQETKGIPQPNVIADRIEQQRRAGEKQLEDRAQFVLRGGMLDQMADNTVSAMNEQSRTWLNWGGGKS